jgi:hypothetical protein
VLGGRSLEPTDAEAKLVTSEGGWLFQILAEPRSQLVQLVGIEARDVLPLQSLPRRLKYSLLDTTVLVLAAYNEAEFLSYNGLPIRFCR